MAALYYVYMQSRGQLQRVGVQHADRQDGTARQSIAMLEGIAISKGVWSWEHATLWQNMWHNMWHSDCRLKSEWL